MTDDAQQIGADLTPREREVLSMVAAGMTNREIGLALFISESTAGVHVSNLMAKLGVGSRTEAASVAYRAGLVESVSGEVTVVSAPEARGALEEPEPTGPWGRLTHAFDKQVEHHPRRVAAAGIGGLAVLFLITVGLAMAVFGEEPVAGEDRDQTATPRPSASPSPRPSASPTPSPSASPTAAPIGGAGVDLEVDGLALVRADDLSLRTNPGTEAPQIGFVPEGDLGFVVAGPVTEDGYVWYQLAAVDRSGPGCGSPQPAESLACQDWIGWAAAGGNDGEDWLAPHEPSCPAVGNVAGLMALQPLEGLACFESAPMTLRVYRTANPLGGDCAYYSIQPTWLGFCGAVPLQATESLSPTQDAVFINVTPNLGNCTILGSGSSCPFSALGGRWVDVVAHFDDAAAQSCVADDGSVVAPDPVLTVLQCRARIVVTRITPTDGLGTLDTRQDAWDPLGTIGYRPHGGFFNPGVAQIFRAGKTGELTAIQLYLSHLQGSTEPIVIQLRLGSPTGVLLGSSQPSSWPTDLPTDSGGCLPPQCLALDSSSAWVTIKFDQRPDIEAGQAYALVLPPAALTGSDNPTYLLTASSQDDYGDGMAMYYGLGDSDSWQAYVPHETGSGDLTFRTLVR